MELWQLLAVMLTPLAAWLMMLLARAVSPSFDGWAYLKLLYARHWCLFHLDRFLLRPWSIRTNGGAVYPRAGDKGVSAKWLTRVLRRTGVIGARRRVSAVSLSADGLHGGFVGAMARLTLTYEPARGVAVEGEAVPPPATMVMKSNPSGLKATFSSVTLGSAREGMFYREVLAGQAAARAGKASTSPIHISPTAVPNIYYAAGSQLTGRFVVIMEDLGSAGQCSPLLGNQCWGAPPPPPEGAPTPMQLLETAFRDAADLHARHWNSPELLRPAMSWMRNVRLQQGYNRGRFEASKASLEAKWKLVRAAVTNGGSLEGQLVFTPRMIELIDSSLRLTSWKAYQDDLKTIPFTLCHGDHHAGNQLWRLTPDPRSGAPAGLLSVDWAEIGVGHGATEISQYLISNATVELRRAQEKRLLRQYWERLVKGGVDGEEYDFETCWARYVRGGADRWIQMLILLCTFTVVNPKALPPPAAQWFHDQVWAFVEDHVAPGTAYPLGTIYCFPADFLGK